MFLITKVINNYTLSSDTSSVQIGYSLILLLIKLFIFYSIIKEYSLIGKARSFKLLVPCSSRGTLEYALNKLCVYIMNILYNKA